MASENPGSFQNVIDGVLQDGDEINDTNMQKLIQNQRHIYELIAGPTGKAGETRAVYSHSHGDLAGSAEDGLLKRRTIFSQAFMSGTDFYARWTLGAAWTELFRFRAAVGPFQRLFHEMRYLVSANGVKIRAEMWDWADSSDGTDDAGGNGTQYVEESSYGTATTATWHTIDGSSYTSDGAGGYNQNGGSDTKLQYVNRTNSTTLDEACNQHEFRIFGYASAGSTTFDLYNWVTSECKTDDEGGSGLLT